MDLNKMIALVTGAADGIGAGIAERLAAEGMRVVIADRDETAGRATAARTGGSFVAADVATEAGVRAAVAAAGATGPVGVLVTDGQAALPGLTAGISLVRAARCAGDVSSSLRGGSGAETGPS